MRHRFSIFQKDISSMQLDSAKKRVSGKRTNDRTITTVTFDFHGCIHARVYQQPAWTRRIREIWSMVS